MRIYVDTEFTDWDNPDADLISIALVGEGRCEFYAECTEFDRHACTTFVEDEVLPLLGAPGVPQYDRVALKVAVLEWLRRIPAPQIAVDYDGDWHLLQRLLGDDIPEALTVTNIYGSLDQQALEDYYRQHDLPKHHALHDAKANQYASMLAFTPKPS